MAGITETSIDPPIQTTNARESAVEVVVETETEETEEVGEGASYFNLYNNLVEQNKMILSYSNVQDIYNGLSNNQFASLIWLFKYYDELFDSGLTENLSQEIYDSFDVAVGFGEDFYEQTIKMHKVFKNLLFNIKEISFQQEDGTFKVMSFEDLEEFYSIENKFVVARIGMGQKLKDSLATLGFSVANEFRGIATARHDVGYKYFVLSSEPMNNQNYLDILPDSREEEEAYINTFSINDVTLPEFSTETDISFTYLKSNYVYQSETANMSLKGLKQELSTTETTTDIGVTSIGGGSSTNNTGY